jgi:hypothetical protein
MAETADHWLLLRVVKVVQGRRARRPVVRHLLVKERDHES